MSTLSELLPAGSGGKNVDFVASGTLTSGQTVALKTDGKVEAIGTSSAAMSSGFNVDADQPATQSAVYVSSVDRVAVMYMNQITTYPEAVIGQITGSSISFGTPQVISTDIQSVDCCGIYDENADRIVLFATRNSNNYVGVVGTVTGGASNTSSWGSYQTIGTSSGLVKARAAVYMPDVQKCFLVVWDNTVSNGQIIGSSSTVNPNNNTITANSTLSLDSTNGPGYTTYGVGITYDSVYGVAILGYNNGYSTTVKAVQADVSSNGTITKGTTRSLSSSGYYDFITIDFDSKTGKCGLIGIQSNQPMIFGVYSSSATTLAQGNNGPYTLGALAAGNVEGRIKSNGNNEFIYAYQYNASGTQKPNYWTLYIDSNNDLMNTSQSTDFGTAGANGEYAIAYDTTAQKFVIVFYSIATTDKNQAHLYNFTTTNTSNFIGIADAAISDTATGSVTIKGGIATNASLPTLTPNTVYYVQSDGTINTTSTGTRIGKALSSTSINLEFNS